MTFPVSSGFAGLASLRNALVLLAYCAAAGDRLAAGAERKPVLVELFTSEGCSSCPPADSLLIDLDRRQDVPGAEIIVLSEHVDYWDHLGWRDPFSSSQITQRQNDYGSRFNLDSVYTPMAVIDGAKAVVGSNTGEVRRAIGAAAARQHLDVQIESAIWNGDTVEAAVKVGDAPDAALYVALADESDQTSVARGENGGHMLHHVAVVRALVESAKLHGPYTDTVRIKLGNHAANRPMRIVVFAQQPSTGYILGAAVRRILPLRSDSPDRAGNGKESRRAALSNASSSVPSGR